jgi:hypothetical protein
VELLEDLHQREEVLVEDLVEVGGTGLGQRSGRAEPPAVGRSWLGDRLAASKVTASTRPDEP